VGVLDHVLFDAALTLLGLVFIRESYTPVLLKRKARKSKVSSSSAAPLPTVRSWSFWQDFFSRLSGHMARPILLLVRRPVIQAIAVLLGLSFGVYTSLLSTFATLYIERYGQSQSVSSLHYIAIAIGTTISAQVGGRVMDVLYRRLRDRSPDKLGRPEFRVPWMVPGVVLTPVGLFWYGWAAERGAPWAVVDVGAAVFVLGNFITSQALLAYMLDEFGEYAASANAATKILSFTLGFVFPIFAPQLYERLGYGWGNSLLAFVWIVLAVPAPFAIWLWGDKLRAIGRKEKGPASDP
jgi:hypothetical protein